MFTAQYASTPDALAFMCGDKQISYAELERRSNQLANYLRNNGVLPGTLAGVCLERSLDLVVALIGLLKAGGVYLPLDPGYPQERLTFMLEDSRAQVLLTNTTLLTHLPGQGVSIVCVDELADVIAQQSEMNPGAPIAPESPAYVIYTSGSTGLPKGVIAPHRQL
jgi:non-ribosomal peptide synthetase component F